MSQDERFEHGSCNLLFLWRELAYRLELKAQLVRRSALPLIENHVVQADMQGLGEVDQRVERGLGGAGLVALNLIDMQAGEIGEALLGEAAGFTQLSQAGGVLVAGDSLVVFPRRGRPTSLPGRRELLAVRPYVLVYRIPPGEGVDILRIWHAAQDRPGSL